MIRSIDDPALSLTALNAAASRDSLIVAIAWWPVGFLLAIGYAAVLFRLHRGKVPPDGDVTGHIGIRPDAIGPDG
jgi:hypothetical protein